MTGSSSSDLETKEAGLSARTSARPVVLRTCVKISTLSVQVAAPAEKEKVGLGLSFRLLFSSEAKPERKTDQKLGNDSRQVWP